MLFDLPGAGQAASSGAAWFPVARHPANGLARTISMPFETSSCHLNHAEQSNCSYPGVTSALIGPRTMEQLDDLLAGVDVTLTDDVLDRIDEIVPPGADVGTLDMAYRPPALQRQELRRRPVSERAAA